MGPIEQLLSSVDITSLIFYIFLFFFAFKGAFEVSEFFYNKLKTFFTHKTNTERTFEDVKKQIDKIYDEIDLIKLSMQAYSTDLNAIQDKIKEDEERIMDDIRLTFKVKHHKYMALGAIDDFTLSELEKKYAYYTSKGGNGYVKTLFNDISELKIVDASEIEKLRAKLYEKEVSTND